MSVAEKGNAIAQCNIGYYYDNGIGVERSLNNAIMWYKKAAGQGDETAKRNLDNIRINA
jgi:TPR repeat protein